MLFVYDLGNEMSGETPLTMLIPIHIYCFLLIYCLCPWLAF